ncbi:hypothetical protein [Rickettsia endosymbiont of Orchestes rusci]|uniref:hypothetical protein n=1 Tax=Rickettsia endosymbiont of Orchestes rusci TaxID=3066250 RepID=UPI00313C7E06
MHGSNFRCHSRLVAWLIIFCIMIIISMVSCRGLTGVVAWMVKNALGVIPA